MTKKKTAKATPGSADVSAEGHPSLADLDEATLRRRILLPLFTKMGFRDVTENHGTGELGKDIVMWTSDPLVPRVNYGVVAKAGPISGRADGGSSTAATTASQIRQCFGAPYRDSQTAREQVISHVIVVASGHIGEATQAAILACLEPHHHRAISFVNGAKLAELVEAHLEPLGVLARADALRDALTKATSPGWGFDVAMSDQTLNVSFGPKPGSSVPPVNAKIIFDGDASNAAAASALLERHLRTGAPVKIDGARIVSPEIDRFIRALGPGQPEQSSIILPPRTGAEMTLLINLRHGAESGTIGPVLSKVTQAGTEEITIVSTRLAAGWGLTMVVDLVNSSLMLSLNSDFTLLTANVVYKAMRIVEMLSQGADIEIRDHERGLIVGEGAFVPGSVLRPEEALLQVLKAAAAIERETGLPVFIPQCKLSFDDVSRILESAQLLTGQTLEKLWTGVSIGLSAVDAGALDQLIDAGGGGMVNMRQEVTMRLFDRDYPMGIQETTLYGAKMSASGAAKLRRELGEGQSSHTMRLMPAASPGRVTVRLLRKEEATF